ncbi:hypothetical protein GJ698_07090 [Pseudoduganella sp. FT26W]|uniref:DUF6968 domain-containing protein n=1 Tax=Duganella aquatilis TaxID=2666082 RepID=A0A844D8G8_9BURK|nr:hypothetical protein [Duganella aquatilis]MRW83860.1 hypothetical protein [Duganella aquatilis]
MMKIENPTVIATHDFIWHKKDGTTAPVQVMIGAPYRKNIDWACPCAIFGFEGRYSDIVGISSLQAMSLALNLVSKRLKWLIENGEILDLSEDGKHLDLELITSLFGGR